MFKKILQWLEKYTDSKAKSTELESRSGAVMNNIRREKNIHHEDLLK